MYHAPDRWIYCEYQAEEAWTPHPSAQLWRDADHSSGHTPSHHHTSTLHPSLSCLMPRYRSRLVMILSWSCHKCHNFFLIDAFPKFNYGANDTSSLKTHIAALQNENIEVLRQWTGWPLCCGLLFLCTLFCIPAWSPVPGTGLCSAICINISTMTTATCCCPLPVSHAQLYFKFLNKMSEYGLLTYPSLSVLSDTTRS